MFVESTVDYVFSQVTSFPFEWRNTKRRHTHTHTLFVAKQIEKARRAGKKDTANDTQWDVERGG